MPEGDTIHRAARTLERALGGKRVTRFATQLPRLARVDDQSRIAGRDVERVYAIGKHLFIDFSGGLTLRSHMRMNGSWHIYRPGERWQKRRRDMRIVVETSDFVAVAFNVWDTEFERNAPARTSALHIDLASDSFDAEEALARIRSRGDREIADALLNQRLVAGIGNVYKSELLFLCGLDPFARVAAIGDDRLRQLLKKAQTLLRYNVNRTAGGRATRSSMQRSERLWVYGRRQQPCRRCGTPIEMRRQGRDARVTFWCPCCQPSVSS